VILDLCFGIIDVNFSRRHTLEEGSGHLHGIQLDESKNILF